MPLSRRNGLRIAPPFAGQHDKPRQVRRLAAEAIQGPRSHAGPPRNGSACIHDRVCRIMVDLIGRHRSNNRQIISHLGSPGKKVAHFLA